MKNRLFLFVCMLLGYCVTHAQVFIKTEYFGSSSYRYSDGDVNKKLGDSKGSAKAIEAGINIPLSEKLDENGRPDTWSMGIGGSYTKFNNEHFTQPLMVDEMMSLGVSLSHMKAINEKWSMVTSLGVGVFAATTDLSKIGVKNVLGSLGVVFIRHLRPNLDIGGGISINNVLKFPMAFPAFYLSWRTNGKYEVNVNLDEGLSASVGYKASESFRLKFIGEINGQIALLEQDGKDKIFSHMHLVTGLRPEFSIGKKVSIPITLGISAWRPAKITDRTFKGLFNDQDYYFQLSPYVSAGISVNL